MRTFEEDEIKETKKYKNIENRDVIFVALLWQSNTQ